MKGKWTKIITCSLAILGLSRLATASFSYARAEENATAEELFMPTSYEQYLPLTSPTDVALTTNHIAVADEKNVYVYSHATGSYATYTHDKNVNELQFSGNKLYFLDQGMNLFSINANALPETVLDAREAVQHCISFVISSDVVYFTKSSGGQAQIYSAPLSDPTQESARSSEFSTKTNPALTVSDGELYFTHDDLSSQLYPLSDLNKAINLPHKAISSIVIDDGILYYTASGSFYAYRLSDLVSGATSSPVFEETAAYSAITGTDDGYIYAVCGSSIKQYDTAQKTFTDYEISAASNAENRLSRATDTVLAGNLLITADSGNNRISVTNVHDKTTHTFPSIAGNKIVSDGKTVLIASETAAVLYELTTGETLAAYPTFASEIVGITNVYGTYYFATKTGFCKITDEYSLSPVIPVTSGTPALLTSDVYGMLYVGFASGSLFSYTEQEFLDPETKREEKDKLATLPTETEKLLVDFNRNLYALKNGELQIFEENAWHAQSLTKRIVYTQSEQTNVSSVCFSETENQAYILYAGNFLVRTTEFNLPTLSAIQVNGADDSVFGETGELTLVEIAENTLYIRFDIQSLNGADVFPYLCHERKQDKRIALKLGETERFNLVAVFEETTRTYVAALVEKISCVKEIPETEFLKPTPDFTEEKTGYVTNAVPLYKFPYLTDLLTVFTLPKNAEVKVLGEIEELDYKYYRVEYVDEQGETHTGYLPKSYVSAVDARYPETEQVTAGDVATDVDSLWRAAFILLGFSAIAVLADFLILRKKK